tara:strand:+ start:97 stop:333 length:237 start_codon:yes stop_codon:yes gene_type:complete
MKNNNLTTKRFIIRKSLLGSNTIINFTNKKGEKWQYDHDEIYSTFQEKFESMACFQEYKSYTNSNTVPKFCRELATCS